MRGHSGHNHQTWTFKRFTMTVNERRRFPGYSMKLVKRQQHKRSRVWGKRQASLHTIDIDT